MFAVIYRVYLKPGKEQEYQRLWNQIASYFVQYRGALGSCLHRTEEGLWVAYSRWPSKAVRDASWPKEREPSEELPEDMRKAIIAIKDCADEERKMEEIHLEVVADLLEN
jgi:heme-degrading monooxygenase HmoA